MTNALINGIYAPEYWNLSGVSPINAPPELWWSSHERKPFEDGLPTSEFLELDFGRVRSFNFLNFNILQKPINITVEYDVWSFDSGIKFWQPITRLAGERFDSRVDYSPNSANPWKNCQFYFTNAKGDMVSCRYMRLRFDRRDEPWPNGDLAGTFPWSIDVKDLRAARYAVNLNDARGILINQGKVVRLFSDPENYRDVVTTTLYSSASSVELFAGVDAGTVTGIGTPSATEFYGNIAVDGGTVTTVGIPSGLSVRGTTDAATITEVGVPSGAEVLDSQNLAMLSRQVYTAGSNTWTKPAGAVFVDVVLVGGGGGGGSGSRGAAGTTRLGGPGGGGSQVQVTRFAADDLGSTESAVVGNGGAGGAAVTVNNTQGNLGSAGGDSSFGSYIKARGGRAPIWLSNTIGQGGSSWPGNGTNGSSGSGGTNFSFSASSSDAASTMELFSTVGGGAGGSLLSSNSFGNSSNGGFNAALGDTEAAVNHKGTSSHPDAFVNSIINISSVKYAGIPGRGGGGGYAQDSAAGGNGSSGTGYGAGGGGGGASLNGFNSGGGAGGASGLIVVTTWGRLT